MACRIPAPDCDKHPRAALRFSLGSVAVGVSMAFALPSPGGPSLEELRAMSGLELLFTLEQLHGELAWNRPEVSEFAAITLVMELPEALGNLLQAVQS